MSLEACTIKLRRPRPIWFSWRGIIDVGLDMRMSSPRFGMAEAIELSAEDPTAVFWPAGVRMDFWPWIKKYCDLQVNRISSSRR